MCQLTEIYKLEQGDEIVTQKGRFLVVSDNKQLRTTATIRIVPANGLIKPTDFVTLDTFTFMKSYWPFFHSHYMTKQYVLDAGANFKKVRSLT
jgi:hypothetical protein